MDSPNLINRLAEELVVDHARKKNQVYLITSALDGEGVSHICKLLAAALRKSLPGGAYVLSISNLDTAEVLPGTNAPEFYRTEFFNELRNSYEIILIDAGGLLNRGKAIPFLAECHACVLVTRARKTRRGQVRETIAMLKRYGIPILGTVLNGVEYVIPRFLYKYL